MIGDVMRAPGIGEARYTGTADEAVRFTLLHQLLDGALWKRLTDVFGYDSDSVDNGWRCEFWGKTMRGGCLTYRYTGDEALYETLTAAAERLLALQRDDGSFSTYPAGADLCGWDVWGRKYVLSGFLHYYGICRDETLKERILTAMTRHAFALRDALRNRGWKITQTSESWGGVNSASFLEPLTALVALTKNAELLAFAREIFETGGCRDGNLCDAVRTGLRPHEFPEVKAYETISFFEGVLGLYELTGETELLAFVLAFADSVRRNEITLIGSAGCTHELFDHSALRQTDPGEGIMQETCVTVTWMRLNARLFMLTGKERYFTELERSAYNGLYGAINRDSRMLWEPNSRQWMSALPFDSYSPLVDQRRGRAIGGLKFFREGGFYGCCACIASAGTALLPLFAVTACSDGVAVNTPLPGSVRLKTPGGAEVTLEIETAYPAKAGYTLRLHLSSPERFALRLRAPAFIREPAVTVCGEAAAVKAEDGCLTLRRTWRDGDCVTFEGDVQAEKKELNGKTAFVYGPLALARDAEKEDCGSLKDPVRLAAGALPRAAEPEAGETVRFLLDRENGAPVILTDYAACGRRWDRSSAAVSVWNTYTE